MVTLAEVAQHAGVSASTVSHVLSGKRSVSAATRQGEHGPRAGRALTP
ncbi:LacI family DNA-binding transcriptional regulator, partial [Streptomyces sp. NPDC001414]